jgi:hypothetical protein
VERQNDSGGEAYSRIPTPDDLTKICRSLEENNVKYVLVGGWAMAFHGAVRATVDIDLLVDPSPENVLKLKGALSILEDNQIANLELDDIKNLVVVRVADEVVVDLMGRIGDVNASNAGIEIIEYNGVKIRVANLETMIKTKQGLRLKDQNDLLYLTTRHKQGSVNNPQDKSRGLR